MANFTIKTFAITAMLALAGCAHLEKPGVTQDQIAADKDYCGYESEKATATTQDTGEYIRIYLQCMHLKGYTIVSN